MDLKSPKDCQFGFLRAKFDFEHRAKHFDTDLFFYSGESINHYTDLKGLFGIIESGGFWLSDHRFLNDSEEFKNGKNLASDILEALSNKKRHKEFSLILAEACKFLNSYEEQASYICSFSKDKDSLDQWRSYANDGKGISITFDNTMRSSSHFFIMPIMALSKVIYNDKEKSKIILRTIRKFKKEYLLDIEHENSIDIKEWGSQMSEYLAVEFMNFKHPAFESEKEVRLIVDTHYLNHFKGVKYRVSEDRITPYLTSKDLYNDVFKKDNGNFLLPIKEIHVGPTANQEMAIRSITEYMRSKGYKEVKILKSSVPYRR